MTIQPTLPPARLAADALEEMLQAISAIDVFRNGVDEDNVRYDDDKKVHGYAVLWAGAGRPVKGRLSSQVDRKEWGFQVTAAGGDDNRALWVADLVSAALVGQRIPLPNGRTSTPIDQDVIPDRVIRDATVNPSRYYLPLLFSCRMS